MPVYTSNTPRANRTRRFGEGLGERNPTYRAPVALSDMQWWADEARREEDAEYDRMAAIAAMEARFDGWF